MTIKKLLVIIGFMTKLNTRSVYMSITSTNSLSTINSSAKIENGKNTEINDVNTMNTHAHAQKSNNTDIPDFNFVLKLHLDFLHGLETTFCDCDSAEIEEDF